MSGAAILAHRLDGDGETVLLLNGGMMSIASWEPVAQRLQSRYRLLRCDFRGQLLVPGPAHRELAGNVDDLVALLDELALERVHVLGTSFGAEVGLLLAALRPERVRSLVAVTATDYAATPLHQGTERLRTIVSDIRRGDERGRFHDELIAEVYSAAYLRSHRQELQARREQMASLPEVWFEGLDGILACTETLDLRPFLSRIRCPSLVIIAGDDQVMPVERSRALAAAIGAEVAELAGSGHALVAEQPEWLAERCLAFLDRQPAPPT
ncbi:MAG: alpha/beta fold hydrolase [bacterium]|nr:alpha/beta fold hydrolase [bacterium]